jgi:hypothetical protein
MGIEPAMPVRLDRNRTRRRVSVSAALALLFSTTSPVSEAQARSGERALALEHAGLDAGYFTLSWDRLPGEHFDLEMKANGGDWKSIYRGPDTSSAMSGLSNGDYRFRVRADRDPWRGPLEVTVRHHPLGRAIGFLVVGAIVFAALVLVLARGVVAPNRRDEA